MEHPTTVVRVGVRVPARSAANARRAYRNKLEESVALLLGKSGQAWRRKCFRAWALHCMSLVPAGVQLLRAARMANPQDTVWIKLIEDKSAVVTQCWARRFVAGRKVGRLLEERRQVAHLKRIDPQGVPATGGSRILL